MWTHDLTNQHYMAKHQNNRLTAAWGARFLRLYDEFRVDAEGSILGTTASGIPRSRTTSWVRKLRCNGSTSGNAGGSKPTPGSCSATTLPTGTRSA